jgi:TonB-dependent Receptor Plug Domain
MSGWFGTCARRSTCSRVVLLLIGWSATAHADAPKPTATADEPNAATVEDPSPATAATAPTAATPAATASAAPVDEVRVVGRRSGTDSPTQHRMGRAEVRVVPGAFGDPFRAIDTSPSLVPLLSGLPYYYIRGAPPSAVGYYVDEVRVPYLFHFGLGPSVVQPALIDEVSLHPAAFPARYGRFAGGIVAGQTREPASELHAEGQLRLFDAGAYVEAPFAEGRGSVGVGGRYSYTAAIISLAAPDLTIDYRDYNARASYQLSDRWRATAFAFGAFDYASEVKKGRENVLFASEFHRLDLRLDRRGADGATSRIAATLGFDRTRVDGTRFAQDMIAGVRGRHRWTAWRDVEIELGADLIADSYSSDLPNPYAVSVEDYAQAEALFAPRTETASGAWASATFCPRPGWNITGTLRGDVFTSDGKIGIGPSPRARCAYRSCPRSRSLPPSASLRSHPRLPFPLQLWATAGCPEASPMRTRRVRASRSRFRCASR